MLQRVEPKPITIGERDPIFEAFCQVIEKASCIEIKIAEVKKVGATEWGVWVVQRSAKIHPSSSCVVTALLELCRPDAGVNRGRREIIDDISFTIEPSTLWV